MKNSIKTDIRTWIYSGKMILLAVSCLGVFLTGTLAALKSYNVSNSGLLFYENSIAIKEGKDEFIALLTGASESENIVLDKESFIKDTNYAESQLHAVNPEHALSNCMECGYFLFPLVLTIFSALTVKSDMTHNVMRLRVTREGRWKYFFSKQISMIIVTCVCVVVGVILDYLISACLFNNAISSPVFGLIDVSGRNYPNYGNSFAAIAFFALFILLVLEIGFCLGLIFKSVLIPMGLAFLSCYFIVFNGPYTPLNAIWNFACRFCDFQGSISLYYEKIPEYISVGIIALTFAVPFTAATLIYKYRSAYK